ncbi:MAG: HEAT repeat domain-containing protein [Planctomycetota bacterium]|nr:HEAT repeat domain-containing protein [Planctomycetota bacterium]
MQVRQALPLAVPLLLALASACASTEAEKSPATEAAEGAKSTAPEQPIAQLVEATRTPEPIGKLLQSLDREITAWNNLFLAAQSETDRSKARNLEKTIMTTTHNRRQEILEQLESGPLTNRIVAAAALGFTRDQSVQSPLLAALDDPEPQVVSAALLGLWLLGRQDTPLDRIASHLTMGDTEEVRTNAALCLSTLVKSGARSPSALPALRIGLLDSSPTVRAHCCLALAELADSESFQAIADMMTDPTTLAAAASARSVAFLASKDIKLRGKAARAMVGAWIRAEEPAKTSIYRSMVELSGTNYGSDEEEWSKWATRLP